MTDHPAGLAELDAEARRVLDQNWMGTATLPSPRLYPHQWSWDSAFVAIGNRFDRWDRSVIELSTLFDAQWSNGMIPHMVFDATLEGYHPSKEWWDSPSSPHAPTGHWTSGICQPAVHALAVQMVVDAESECDQSLLRRWVDHLVAWHDYLFDQRVLDSGLAEIWHPWESGMDNAPMWDGPLAAVETQVVPSYRRVDTDIADSDERPSDEEYDAYAVLVDQLRSQQYTPADPSTLSFRVQDVLFNAILCHGERVLADLVERVGGAGERHRERAAELSDSMENALWDEEAEWFLGRDARSGTTIPVRSAGGALALLCIPGGRRASAMVRGLTEHVMVDLPDGGAVVLPSVMTSDPQFEAQRYWRGPAWANVTWLLALGLDELGEAELATSLRNGVLQLTTEEGMREFFDPTSGEGLGGVDFSWTAALTIDILRST